MKFYTVSGTAPEYFYSTTVDQAVTDYLDNTPVGDWSATVEVEEWETKTIDNCEFNEAFTDLEDAMNEEYGNEDDAYCFSSEAKTLYKAFTDQVRKEFPVFQCDRTGLVKTVDVQEFNESPRSV